MKVLYPVAKVMVSTKFSRLCFRMHTYIRTIGQRHGCLVSVDHWMYPVVRSGGLRLGPSSSCTQEAIFTAR